MVIKQIRTYWGRGKNGRKVRDGCTQTSNADVSERGRCVRVYRALMQVYE